MALLLFEFCHKTTGMNGGAAERQQRRRDAVDRPGMLSNTEPEPHEEGTEGTDGGKGFLLSKANFQE